MTWFYVDDMFWEHPKTAGLSDAAAGLWAKAGSYSKYFGTDGHVPAAAIRRLSASRKVAPLVAELCAAKLWDSAPDGDGFVFHNWTAYQSPSEPSTSRRSAHARAQKAYRERKAAAARDHAGDHAAGHADHGGDHAAITGDRSPNGHRDDHTVIPSRARVTNPIDKPPSSSSAGTSARASDDDDRSPGTSDDGGWAGAGFITPAQARAAIVTATVREVTGLVIDGNAAEAIAADVLGGRTVRDAAGYLRRAIIAESSHDPALGRWLASPASASCRPSPGDRHPSANSAREVLDHARHPEGHDPGRVADPEAARRGADRARQALADRPKPPEPEPPPPPVYTPDGGPDPAAMRAAQAAAEAEAAEQYAAEAAEQAALAAEAAEPGDDEPELPPEPPEADPSEVPF